jgi:hypothetical protein
MINKIKIEETKDFVSVVEWFVEWLKFIVDKNNRMITDLNKKQNKLNKTMIMIIKIVITLCWQSLETFENGMTRNLQSSRQKSC